ncbi:E3 ubiquitin-protein ligase RNF213 isoform X3 [Myotis yumanensis]|uniref:E3 ubiquitin-protein ligase RNF213 isoform X3 n=1 Tax=Myotis yumanensis TaxID=159337 RepID=UPI0038D3A33F
MECPSCGHVSKEDAPKFCCECGRRLPPVPDSENVPKATSVPEWEESGLELKEDGAPQVTSVPDGEKESGQEDGAPQATSVPEGDMESGQEDGAPQVTSVPDGEKESGQEDGAPQATSVPEGDMESGQELKEEGGPQAMSVPEGEMESGQELKEDGGPSSSLGSSDQQAELAQPSSQSWKSQKSKRKKQKKKNQKASVSKGLESLSASPSTPGSLQSLADPGVQDAAPPQSPAQQGEPPSQPLGGGCPQGQAAGAAGAAGAASAGESPGSAAPRDQTPGGAPPGGKGQEGAGPPASASGKEGAAQEHPPPMLQGDHLEPRNEPPAMGQQAAPPASGATDAAAKLVEPPEGTEVQSETQTLKQKPKQKAKPPGAPASPPAAPEHGQETEPKGKAAVSGEKAKPGDVKKPDRGHGGDSAAPKGDGAQKELKADTQEVPSSPLSPGEGVTVFFHAILSKDFNFDPDQHQLFIRGGEELGTPGWRLNVCELHATKMLDTHGVLVEGSAVLPKRLLDRPAPYKYVVVNSKATLYEFIYKPQDKESKQHVNRCLHLRSALLGSGDWHQYDDIICKRPDGKLREIWNNFMDHFVDQMKKNVKGKQLAASIMLDRVLSVLQPWSAVNLSSFFTQFRQFYSVVSEPMVYEAQAQPWTSLNYPKEQVRAHLWECLQKHMAPFLERREDTLPPDAPVRRKLRMGLIALHVAEELELPLSGRDLGALCDLLCASACASSARDLLDDLSLIFETHRRWREYLLRLCHRSMELDVGSWVGTLPVLHLCMGPRPPARQPGTQPEDVWAALEGISFSEFRRKRAHEKERLLQFMVGKKHLLDADEALFQSWFSLLPLSGLDTYLQEFTDYLTRFPARVLDCLQGTCYRLQGLKDAFLGDLEDVDRMLKTLLHLLDMFQDQVLEAPSVPSYLTVCLKLHEAVCTLAKGPLPHHRPELPALSAEIVCRVIRLKPVADSVEAQGSDTGTRTTVRGVVQGALSTTRAWLGRAFKQNMFRSFYAASVRFTYSEEIQVWRWLVEIPFPEEHGWKASLLGDLAARLKQESPRAQISAYCSPDWAAAGADDSVSRCFENCVIEAVSSACQSQLSILEGVPHSDLRRFGTLVSAVVTKSWPRRHGEAVDDLAEVLRYLLTWPDVTHLFKLYGTDEKLLAHITEDGKKLMATADSVFTKVAEDLLGGAVLVGQLELIWSHRARFLDIWELKRKSLSPQERKHDMEKVLDYRWEELRFLQEERRRVDSLLKLCEAAKRWVEVDCGEIAKRHAEDLSGKRLNEAVMARLSPTSRAMERVTHYNLSAPVREMAAMMDSLKDSHVFRTFWAEAARAEGTQEEKEEEAAGPGPLLDMEDAYATLYLPCLAKFRKLYEDLKAGELTFGEVRAIFSDFVDKYEDLTSDLRVMRVLDPSDPGGWIQERVVQVREYHHLHRSARAAKVILEVKEALGLTGDFSLLNFVLRITDAFENSRGEKLGQINRQVILAIKLLRDLDEARCRCLQELVLAREFVPWVREAVEGVNELKVFVDLAFIFAGENDMDVDRVACFHDAVQGYSSLLYKLDESQGFQAFSGHLKELWKALDNDPHLPSKLRDSARNLGWLKTVKESHGSVERSSLTLARAINSRGIYVIQAPAEGQKISPDTVLHLLLPESHKGRPELRSYSLEELKELMNKLMLMSGKKDHNSADVEEFSEVFCNVQRLVRAFLNLYSAGSFLFRAWKVQVHCGQPEPVRMHFALQLLKPLRGLAPLAPLLEALCRRMERFLDQWEAVVAQQRAEHFYLNYYTAEQLVHLSSELARPTPGATALAMLSFIKRQCTPRDVAEAFRDPHGDGGAATHELQTVMETLPILLLSESGLVDKLGVIMEQFLGCTRAFLPHCLDLEALGRGLARLAARGGPPVMRRLPKGLRAGQPNLIVCGHSDVLPAALAVYMQSPEQPLPTYDEVLLCTPGTAFEEVALLLRRCLSPGAPGRGVYSLLFADQLGYEVARRAEELLQALRTRPHREDFQLVLVCDSEREHCYLPSALSQHRVPATPQAPLADARAYLAHHYQVPRGTPSAAAAFRDRMCVGIVASARAGVGKSLYVKRLHETLQRKFPRKEVPLKVIRLMDPQVDESQVLGSLLPFLDPKCQTSPAMFHLDVTSSVQAGVWAFLFKLLVLQHLMDSNGKMWLRSPSHLYIIEILEGHSALPTRPSKLRTRAPQFSLLDVFPKVTCRPPKEVMEMELSPEQHCREPGMDPAEFCSETFQRPFQYLNRFHQNQNLDTFQYQKGRVEGTPQECLQHLLLYCGVLDPSWAELRNFARFLNCQLRDCEASIFCDPVAVGDTLQGFKNFVVTFMICMARDFATPTLRMSDQSPGAHAVAMDGVTEEDIAPFSLRRRWESEPHPYLFFNGDRISMTFIGFHLEPTEKGTFDAVDPANKRVIKRDVLTKELYQGLLLQGVPFNVDFDALPRHEKLERLCLALGVQWPVDPDETYELTTDNMLKILAVEMRFRCGIPVIVMGETGCGKTRLIRFLSELRRGGADAETLQLVKVHGGTSADMIYGKVLAAEALAQLNSSEHGLDTVLFFDEANTTGAISCIKEVLCDRTVGGQPLAEDSGLHVIAACNPYRKHSPEMIARLEAAGLGYRVRAEDTADRLGSIPLRQLVYRVHALPPSLVPLVWDFGQLNNATERKYIQQIVRRLVGDTPIGPDDTRVISDVLYASQCFMRRRENECSFVSLRDVERCVRVFRWFYDHSAMLLSKLPASHGGPGGDSPDDSDTDSDADSDERGPVLWALVLAAGVCYHASLEKQDAYRRAICALLPPPYDSSKAVLDAITRTQDLFLEGVSLRKTVAKNLALKENVFMMAICIELKIPLFLVGKPGSSKSLAKTIVADAMQGPAAPSELFRSLKQVYLVSFQCSPHSTPQGIVGTFKHCARLQQGRDLEQYVSVVVLDEVGLAEDSPQMPLKALHPLLEDGCIEDDPAPHKKVGFIGISNWALDPAKMNRGIFVSRGSPSQRELIESARGICASEPLVQERIQAYFRPLARAYEAVCAKQDKEFFGLRDYYSLIKMVFAAAQASNRRLSPRDIAQAVLRNFSGKDEIQALDIFATHLPEAKLPEEASTLQLIRQNLYSDLGGAPSAGPGDPESRYLLVLTRNYVALQILQRTLFAEDQQPEIIFGSSFPRDQEYAQICRNINRVKICMETGKMVVLLNLQNLYESLYDALNQYYVYLGGQKYVDLGLGTHRVKCRVHPDFRLIVIEEKEVVCQQFPIPLINRLEKHYLDLNTVLEKWQRGLVRELKAWVDQFVAVKVAQGQARYSPSDVFVGYHADTCASVVLQVIERLGPGALSHECYQEVLEDARLVLLDCATPDAIVRLSASALGQCAAQALSREYYSRQQHDSFADFLQAHLHGPGPEHRPVFTEVTTFSRLLTSHDGEMLGSEVNGRALNPTILSLQQFDTEHSFLKEVRNCLASTAARKILIIQTDFEDGARSAQLIASAKYSAINEINKIQGNKACIFVYFITKLSRMESDASYVGFHGGLWRSVHIDDLRRSTTMVADVTQLQDVTISQLFDPQSAEVGREARSEQEEAMEVDTDEPGTAAAGGMETDRPEAPRGHRPALDCGSLLRSCIQSAVALLRDPGGHGQRNVRRVEILLGLLGEDAGDACKASFARAAQVRLHDLLRRQEESCVFGRRDWVVQEASNPDALQEAGTFRHTLWKRVQGAVTPLLASMVAVIDRDSNLELLAKPDAPAWVRELWMFIFSDINLLNIPLVTNDARSNSDMAHILVQSHAHGPGEGCCAIPFSWRIRDYVEELWVQAQYISEPAGPGPEAKLEDIFRQTPLGRFLALLRAEERQELLRSYLRDFLLLSMRVSTRPELELLQAALWSCVQQLRAGSPEEPSLPWVHHAYQHFRVRLQNFSRILTIHPPVLDSLAAAARSQDLAGPEMTLDAWAAVACTELLTRDLLKPSPQAWLRAVKSLAVPLELLCSEGYVQGPAGRAGGLIREVRGPWTRIFSVALFVEHVLLEAEDHSPELRALVTDCVFALDKCLQGNSDIKTLRPFSAVMATLCECKDRASRTFSRFGIQPCHVCLGDPRSPVCLPCDHVFCLDCVRQWLTAGQMACPLCLTELPDGFSPTVSQETRGAIEQHARFRRLCTSFFVDLVSTLCFKDNCPPSKDVVQALLALLFVEKTLFRDAHQTHREHTKSLSPFDDVVDKTPVIRSVVLKLLLKYSFPEVKDYIQDYLSLLERKPFLAQDRTELYVLFSSCLEDSIHERNSALPARDEATCLREEGQFLGACLLRGHRGDPAPEASVERLQETAQIRLCLDRACEVLSELQGGSEPAEERRRFLRQVERFCTQSGNDWHRVYLVRRLASRRGMEFVQSFLRPGHPAQWVFPQEVLVQQEDLPGQMDRYLVHGLEYKAVRDAVGKAVLECKPPAIVAALEACRGSQTHRAAYLLLALFREVAVLYRSRSAHLHPKPEQRDALCKFIKESQTLSPDVREFATDLVTNALPLLRTAGPRDGGLAGTVTELAVHAAVTLLCGQHRVLEPLRNLAFSPATMARAFLPTMPEDMLAQARGWQGLEGVRWYTCPRGHLCAVGECGLPMQQSVCVDCGVPVGGQDHKPSRGFTVVQNEADRTQTGHVLGSPPPGDEAVASDRDLSPAAFLLARLLTHLAMLWGAALSPQALTGIIKPAVRDPGAFLQQHIQRDLQQLMRTLGKSADDTAQVVHLVLCVLLREQHPLSDQRSFSFDAVLSTKQKRNSWEKLLQALLLPDLECLDKTLLEVNDRISRDERISSDPVARIVLGDPAAFLRHLPRASALHCSRVWSCRARVTVEHLRHVVEQKNGRESLPVLWRFLQKEAELRLVKFLPEILALQRDLVKRFQNVPEAEFQSIRGFIDSHGSGGLKQLLCKRVTLFLSTWNKLRRSLETQGEIKLPADYCRADLDLDTEFEVILPRRQGLGLCATALVSYLIGLHNDMVYAAQKLSEEEHSYSVDASEVTDLHVISYEVERDLLPLILANCQYHVAQGGESLQELDLERIQRQVTGRFLQGKPRLSLRGLPTLVYRRDWNYEHLFAAIRSRVPQSPLPHAAASTLGGQLQSYSDACEALSLVEVTLGFLSTAGEDPDMDLNVYLQDKLRMGDQTEQVVKALHLHPCRLRHVIALWQLLSAHKSEQLLRLRKEPFREISTKYRVALSPGGTRLLRTFLNQSSLDVFLLELHEMILLKLKPPHTDFNPDWSLRETLVSYMETKEVDIPPEMEGQFPEEILLCHCVSAWKTAALLKRARQAR